jgi:hypothetical protein
MYNKRGQAALEFLTTYGWAFLVILVMIGALSYFGVLNPDSYVPDACNFGAVLSCSGDYGISYDGTDSVVLVDVTNMLNEPINITQIRIKEKSQATYKNVTDSSTWEVDGGTVDANTLPSQQSDRLRINLTGTDSEDVVEQFLGKKKIFNIEITYVKGSTPEGATAIEKVVPGTITTRPTDQSS